MTSGMLQKWVKHHDPVFEQILDFHGWLKWISGFMVRVKLVIRRSGDANEPTSN